MRTSTQLGIIIAGIVVLGVGLASQGNLRSIQSRTKLGPDAPAAGYLSIRTKPDSLAILPPPPAPGSPGQLRDLEARKASLTLRRTARYSLATADADRSHESTLRAFECAFGASINPREAPALWRLLTKMRVDVRTSSYRAKTHYKRPRPYVVYGTEVCAGSDEDLVRNEGSYPSARGAVGWAHALVLAEINPARHRALLARAREFGESRVVCDAEWLSDVEAGRILAESVVKRLYSSPDFQADLSAARAEVAQATEVERSPASCAPVTTASIK